MGNACSYWDSGRFPYFYENHMRIINNKTSTVPESYLDLEQAVLIMTVEVKGQDTDDLTLALGVRRLVNDCFTSGTDRNESGAYRFSIS